jgi:hypothetical protein
MEANPPYTVRDHDRDPLHRPSLKSAIRILVKAMELNRVRNEVRAFNNEAAGIPQHAVGRVHGYHYSKIN